MTDRDVMQQALEALEVNACGWYEKVKAVTALRTRLSEPVPEPEPVVWATEIIDALQAQYDTEMIQENDSGDALIRLDHAIAAVEEVEKYYTAPPARRPLTDEEILRLLRPALWAHVESHKRTQVLADARAIERAHKITGGNDD